MSAPPATNSTAEDIGCLLADADDGQSGVSGGRLIDSREPPHNPRPRLLLSGLDSLYVSYSLDLERADLNFTDLAYLKEKVRRSRGEEFAELELGSETFAFKPYGKYPYAYVLGNDAFEVALGEHIRPSCYVQYTSKALWQHGLDRITERFHEWCRSLNLDHLLPEVVSRADWAFDYALPSIDFTCDHFVSRAALDTTHRRHRRTETMRFGAGDTVLRVYDKVAEIKGASGKTWFYDLWGVTEGVWRVEFQVRGERLKLAGIRMLTDLKDGQNDLLRELATKHTTLRRPSADTNRARWPHHPLWRALVADIAALPQSGLVRCIDPAAELRFRLHHQGRSIHGFLKGLAALLTEIEKETGLGLDDVLARLRTVLIPHHNELQWREDVERRLAALRLGQW